MKKILYSVGLIVSVAALAMGATGAFFSDSETSTGNTFTAGDIDLKIDNTSYVTDANGILVSSPGTSWSLKDLVPGVDHFFNFADLKPGDLGEDTISIHVGSNNAWMCAAARVTDDSDQTCTDPELADDATCTNPGLGQGELADNLNFAFWHDDGDNVLETDEYNGGAGIFLEGPLSGIDAQGKITLADSASSILGSNTPIPGDTTFYIGKAWCFGDLTATPVAQDGLTTDGPIAPNRVGTGFTCNGSQVNNAAQTDRVQGDMQFYAVQARNNSTFTCSTDYTPTWPIEEEPVGPTVGANLTSYIAPTICDATVDDSFSGPVAPNFNTIQAAINDAGTTAGETICVKAGTYTEDVNVNKSITLAGDGPTLVTLTGVGTGEAGALVVSADNVTVKGFKVIGTGVAAMRISGARNLDTFSFNHAVAATGKNAFLTDGGQSNHTISNNLFEGTGSQLVYVNGFADVAVASTNVDFTSNTFGGTATGPLLGIDANGSSVTLNKFSGTTAYSSIETFEGNNLVNQNNFNVVGQMDIKNGPAGGQFPGTLNAENNWWGDVTPADNVTGLVDFTPFEVAAFPEN